MPLNALNNADLKFDFVAYDKLSEEEKLKKYSILKPILDKALENQKMLGMFPEEKDGEE